MDAYLNFHFTDTRTNQPIDFETFIRAVKNQQFDIIRIEETPVRRPYVTQTDDRVHNRWLFERPEDMHKNLDTSWPGIWVYHNAGPSLSRLISEGLLKDICERCRGSLSSRDFLLTLMLENPVFHSEFKDKGIMQRLRALL